MKISTNELHYILCPGSLIEKSLDVHGCWAILWHHTLTSTTFLESITDSFLGETQMGTILENPSCLAYSFFHLENLKEQSPKKSKQVFICNKAIIPPQATPFLSTLPLKDILSGLLTETFLHTQADKMSLDFPYQWASHLGPVIKQLWAEHILVPGLNIKRGLPPVSA